GVFRVTAKLDCYTAGDIDRRKIEDPIIGKLHRLAGRRVERPIRACGTATEGALRPRSYWRPHQKNESGDKSRANQSNQNHLSIQQPETFTGFIYRRKHWVHLLYPFKDRSNTDQMPASSSSRTIFIQFTERFAQCWLQPLRSASGWSRLSQ